MGEKEVISFRVPVDIVNRIDALVETVNALPELSGTSHNRGSIIIQALTLGGGLEALEDRYRPTKKKKRS